MALLWPNMVLTWFFTVPGHVPCKSSYCWVYHVAPYPRNGQNIALLWPKHGPHMVLQMASSWILINVPMDVPCQISHWWVYPEAPFLKNGNNVALLWPKHGPSNWFFLKLNQCAHGFSMPNFTILDVSHSPLFLEMAKTWPFYGQNMVVTWSIKLILPES